MQNIIPNIPWQTLLYTHLRSEGVSFANRMDRIKLLMRETGKSYVSAIFSPTEKYSETVLEWTALQSYSRIVYPATVRVAQQARAPQGT